MKLTKVEIEFRRLTPDLTPPAEQQILRSFFFSSFEMSVGTCWAATIGENNLSAKAAQSLQRKRSCVVQALRWRLIDLRYVAIDCSNPPALNLQVSPTHLIPLQCHHHQSSLRYQAVIILHKVKIRSQKKREETDYHANHRSLSSLRPPGATMSKYFLERSDRLLES